MVDGSAAIKARPRRMSSSRPGLRPERRSIKPRFHVGLADRRGRGAPPEGNAARRIAIPAERRFRTEWPDGTLARSCRSQRVEDAHSRGRRKDEPRTLGGRQSGGDGLRQGRQARPVVGPQGPTGRAALRGAGRRVQGPQNRGQSPRPVGTRGVGREVGRREPEDRRTLPAQSGARRAHPGGVPPHHGEEARRSQGRPAGLASAEIDRREGGPPPRRGRLRIGHEGQSLRQARERGIPGRSRMSKAELEQALS